MTVFGLDERKVMYSLGNCTYHLCVVPAERTGVYQQVSSPHGTSSPGISPERPYRAPPPPDSLELPVPGTQEMVRQLKEEEKEKEAVAAKLAAEDAERLREQVSSHVVRVRVCVCACACACACA